MEGWIKIHRSLTEHWIWRDPVKLKWWLDILLNVNHEDNKVNLGFELYDCKRGQTIRSLQKWAERWNCNKDTARNFLRLLEKDGMILHENIVKTTRITVCNYDTYQTDLHAAKKRNTRQANAGQTDGDPNNNEKNEKNIGGISDFYKNELERVKTLPHFENYNGYVSFLYGENDLKTPLSHWLKIENQLTYEQYCKLLEKSQEKNRKLKDLLYSGENKPKYINGNKTVFGTLNAWLNR